MAKYVVTRTDGTPVPVDEPYFVVRAQDILAQKMIRHYINELGEFGMMNTQIWKDILAHLDRLEDWQDANRDKVKIPDA